MKITSRYDGRTLWESPCSTMRETVIKAVADKADLCGADLCSADLCGADLCSADLRRANLRGADLRRANLRGANLRDADLCSADLCSADLRRANLRGANLRDADLCSADLCSADLCGANLCGANLRDADLRRANLRGANLCGADLCGANLCGANLRDADLCSADLRGANLDSVRVDFIAAVLNLPEELEFLRAALIDGKVDGSTYTGECACLAGTLAHAKGIEDYYGDDIKNGRTFKADSSSPRERFFLAIKEGDTPENNGASKLALQWTDEAIAMRDNILGKSTSK